MNDQMDIFDQPRDGDTYDDSRDRARLAGQHARIYTALDDRQKHTLAELNQITGDPEASISARIRDLRKGRFGGHTILRKHVENGLYHYQHSPFCCDRETR